MWYAVQAKYWLYRFLQWQQMHGSTIMYFIPN